MRTTSASPGYFGGNTPLGQRPPVPCRECGRDMAPARAGSTATSGTCFFCLSKHQIAIPRARVLIRAGVVDVDVTKVAAFGRGPSKGAQRAYRARIRVAKRERQKLAPRLAKAVARQADMARSAAAEYRRQQQREAA